MFNFLNQFKLIVFQALRPLHPPHSHFPNKMLPYLRKKQKIKGKLVKKKRIIQCRLKTKSDNAPDPKHRI